MPNRFPFPYQRLDVFHVAVELAKAGRALSAAIPRGDKDIARQLRRASGAVPMLVAEGAGRRTPGCKRQRYSEARGECSEVAAAAEVAAALDLVDAAKAEHVVILAGRVAAMLTKLIARWS